MDIINIRIGSTVIPCEVKLAQSAGYGAPYANDDTRTARGGDEHSYGSGVRLTPNQAVAIALSEGHSGELAVMRAIAIRLQGSETADARSAREAAVAHREAAEAELRAEQIRSARQKREAS